MKFATAHTVKRPQTCNQKYYPYNQLQKYNLTFYFTSINLKNLSEKHPGDLFQGTMLLPLPHPYNKRERFWIWFHPCYQVSQEVAYLNDM